MKVNAITLRSGHVIEHDNRLCKVINSSINQPGKGAAVIRVEMRDLESGAKINHSFRTQESIEKLRLDQTDYQFLYADGDDYTFMNGETYEQITLQKDLIGDEVAYLQDSMVVNLESYESKPLSVSLPDSAIYTIAEADPVVKGQTASSSYKPAILDVGVKIMVPPHIEAGTRVVVKITDGTYVERAKD